MPAGLLLGCWSLAAAHSAQQVSQEDVQACAQPRLTTPGGGNKPSHGQARTGALVSMLQGLLIVALVSCCKDTFLQHISKVYTVRFCRMQQCSLASIQQCLCPNILAPGLLAFHSAEAAGTTCIQLISFAATNSQHQQSWPHLLVSLLLSCRQGPFASHPATSGRPAGANPTEGLLPATMYVDARGAMHLGLDSQV
jgi:hypothetical protein